VWESIGSEVDQVYEKIIWEVEKAIALPLNQEPNMDWVVR